MEILRSGSMMREAISTPRGSSRSTQAKVKASLWNARPCGVAVEAADEEVPFASGNTTMLALSAGDAVTVCICPEGVSGGEICRAPLPETSEAKSAVTVKVWSVPTDCRDWVLTWLTPTKVTISPALRRGPTAAVQPLTLIEEPVWLAQSICGDPPSAPMVWVCMF